MPKSNTRRRYSDKEKKAHLRALKQSGLSQDRYAKDNKLSVGSIIAWRKKLSAGDLSTGSAAVASTKETKAAKSSERTGRVVDVKDGRFIEVPRQVVGKGRTNELEELRQLVRQQSLLLARLV